MKRRILRAFALVALAASFASCTTINRTVDGLIKLPTSLIDSAGRSIGNITGR